MTQHTQHKSGSGGGRWRALAAAGIGLLKVVLIVGLLAAGGYAAYWFNATEGAAQQAADTDEQEASRLVQTVIAERADRPVRVRAMGTVTAAREIVVRPRVSGMITEQADSFVPGGLFEAGQWMVQIDPADYEQALMQAESSLAQAEAALQIELGDQAVAEEELELLQVDIPEINRDLILRIPQVNQARAEVRSAEAAVRGAELDLERTRIVAPFNGRLVSRSAAAGDNVSAGDQLATFVGDDEYWVELTTPVSSLRWIEAAGADSEGGSPATVRYPLAWGPDATREGRVSRLIGELEEGSRQARVIVSVPDPLARLDEHRGEPELILGAFVDVEIRGRELEDSFALDRALIRDGDTVWVMGDDDRLVMRSVSIVYRGRERVYIDSGLRDGDRVIRTNLQTPVEGMLLRESPRETPEEGPIASTRSGVADG